MVPAIGAFTLRQEVSEVSAQPGRVLPLAQSARLGPVKHRLDPLAHPPGGHRPGCPDRLQDLQQQRGINGSDR